MTTRRGGYHKFLVQWANKPASEAVWLHADEVLRLAPDLLQIYLQQNLSESSSSRGDAIDVNQGHEALGTRRDSIDTSCGTSGK